MVSLSFTNQCNRIGFVMNTYRIQIEGLVQGVGFRPFVYRLANSLSLAGSVENRNNGVFIFVNTDPGGLDNFIGNIKTLAPLHSRIDSISVEITEFKEFPGFSIIKSENVSREITSISPDIAVCDDCLRDMELQEHRIGYPLINCTNCGPRFSIIKGVPYDRSMTTMAGFTMCEKCDSEYKDINDRRFHAQPVACNNCGPVYTIHYQSKSENRIDLITSQASGIIESGKVIALKGTGGYHLVCDAYNEKTITGLRITKLREGKPFAVMCRDIREVNKIAILSDNEKDLMTSWKRPVVLLESRNILASSVSNGLNTVGVILPYMPFHYLLFQKLKTGTILFTSANFSDEPVIIDDQVALSLIPWLAKAVITYNRDIYNRTDDSVTRIIKNREFIIRRSRGYAPAPVTLKIKTEGIFGAGAELTNCFAIGKGKQVILSQHIGDLKNSSTLDFYKTSYERFSEMFRFRPEVICRDMHPDYLSSSFADQIAREQNVAVEYVQHHHAHIASCMAENGVDEKVIGVALDGVGLGSDGNIWGGEFMTASLADFERVMHFEYVPISGGDKVSEEPWRSGISYLQKYAGDTSERPGVLKINELGEKTISTYRQLLTKQVNTFLYSSAGRLFDAVAAITGICLHNSYHAEAPMLLESAISSGISSCYDFDIVDEEISFSKTINGILIDIAKGRSAGYISSVFHNTVGRAVVEAVKKISKITGLYTVVLSGGTFQNKYLSEYIITRLSSEKFFVYFHNQVPANDGGLALGQVTIAAARKVTGK